MTLQEKNQRSFIVSSFRYMVLVMICLKCTLAEDDDRHDSLATTFDYSFPPLSSSMPSLAPSLLPSSVAFFNPTKQHSLIPSPLPTSSLSRNPSISPSHPPSLQQITNPSLPKYSKYPSLVPNPTHSLSGFSKYPSMQPSLLPSQTITAPILAPLSPTILSSNLCQMSNNDLHGTKTNSEVQINYNYEMEYWESYNVSAILFDLENTITETIIESPLTICNKSSTRKLNSKYMIVGISSSPKDLFRMTCQPKAPDVACGIFKGELTIYLKDADRRMEISTMRDEIINEITEIIREGMDSGSLSLSHFAIVNLKYISGGDRLGSPEVFENDAVSNEFPVYGWVLVACIITFCTSTLGLIGKKYILKKEMENHETQSENSEAYLEIQGNEVGQDVSDYASDESTIVFP